MLIPSSTAKRRKGMEFGGGIFASTAAFRFGEQAISHPVPPASECNVSITEGDNVPARGAGRSAQAAIVAALAVVQSGRRIVADIELKTSFDRVNHDILIDRLGRTITDRWMIRLVRASLDPGVMD
jgi:exosome complex RNA-binding protein Csl4